MIKCPAFTQPPVLFDGDSDDDFDEEFADYPIIAKTAKNWKKLYNIIMDKRTDIPLK